MGVGTVQALLGGRTTFYILAAEQNFRSFIQQSADDGEANPRRSPGYDTCLAFKPLRNPCHDQSSRSQRVISMLLLIPIGA